MFKLSRLTVNCGELGCFRATHAWARFVRNHAMEAHIGPRRRSRQSTHQCAVGGLAGALEDFLDPA